MKLSDIDGQDGPFWAAYQTYRTRHGVFDNPGRVPFWFLAKLAHARMAAVRVALEQFGSRESIPAGQSAWTLEKFLHDGSLDDREQIVLGLLGAEEAEIERERLEFEGRTAP